MSMSKGSRGPDGESELRNRDRGSVVVAVDGGNSKTDVVALALDGSLLGHVAAGPSSPHQVGLAESVALVSRLVDSVSGGRPVSQANLYLAGLDLDSELSAYRTTVRREGWTSASTVVDNDIFALLRAGTDEPDAVAVVCGAGLNAVGMRADGITARFVALGTISGDWGGGHAIGETALWHAARAEDRRGPATALQGAIPAEFDYLTVAEVTEAIHLGTLPRTELGRLSPLVFALARQGDGIAADIVDRQADEIALMAASCIARLDLQGAVPVVLGGGVIRSRDDRLLAGIEHRLAELAPWAVMRVVDASPILGASLLALEHAGADAGALAVATAALRS